VLLSLEMLVSLHIVIFDPQQLEISLGLTVSAGLRISKVDCFGLKPSLLVGSLGFSVTNFLLDKNSEKEQVDHQDFYRN